MALLKVICWAIIFITRLRFPPGKSLATLELEKPKSLTFLWLDKMSSAFLFTSDNLTNG